MQSSRVRIKQCSPQQARHFQGSQTEAVPGGESCTCALLRQVPERVQSVQATPTPFINAIFDREPLQRLVQGRTVLVGEAAHPTTPHALRSTNMAIMDAGAHVSPSGQCNRLLTS